MSPLVAAFLVVSIGFALGFFLRSRHTALPEQPIRSAAASEPIASVQPVRRVYPLSVIHGGAYSSKELSRARKIDAIVAAHYADFGTRPKFEKLTRDTMMYVSYRRGNQVYWSQRQHRIPAGETLISDGNCLARARCGNRLSAIARGPVAPKEPAEDVLNTPEAADEPVTYKLADLPAPGGRQFNLALPSTFDGGAPSGATPVSIPASRPAGVSGASPTYFASNPGGGFGGVGGNGSSRGTAPAEATGETTPSSTTVPVDTTTSSTNSTTATNNSPTTGLPTTNTGGSSLPTSPSFPVTDIGGILSDTNTELVPEPQSYALLSLALAGLGLLRLARKPR